MKSTQLGDSKLATNEKSDLKICLIGLKSDCIDEGFRSVFHHITNIVSTKFKKIVIQPTEIIIDWKSLEKLEKFKPHIVHYFTSPTIRSLFFLQSLQILTGFTTVSILSALQPKLSFPHLLRVIRPDLVLTCSSKSLYAFRKYGCESFFLPVGVSLKKFRPLGEESREKLRVRYGVQDKFAILHVGHIKKNRGVQHLAQLQQGNNQVIIVSSVSQPIERDVYDFLLKKKVRILREYFANIEEIYNLADCYVFPTTDPLGSIELPLSVLEAMACNLPVICTRYGGIPDLFREGQGLFFIDRSEELQDAIEVVKSGNISPRTREKVRPFDWQNIGLMLEKIYLKLI